MPNTSRISDILSNEDYRNYQKIRWKFSNQRLKTFDYLFSDKYSQMKKECDCLYGSLFSLRKENAVKSLYKIVPIETSKNVQGFANMNHIRHEFKMGRLVSSLERNNIFFKADRVWLVWDKWPQYLEASKFSMGEEKCVYVVYQINANCETLDTLVQEKKITHAQLMGIFQQLILGFEEAEEQSEFEHRALHKYSVLVTPTNKKTQEFYCNGRLIELPTFGLRVQLTEFALSRGRLKGKLYYNKVVAPPDDYRIRMMKCYQSSFHNTNGVGLTRLFLHFITQMESFEASLKDTYGIDLREFHSRLTVHDLYQTMFFSAETKLEVKMLNEGASNFYNSCRV